MPSECVTPSIEVDRPRSLTNHCAATVEAHHDAALGTILTEGGIFGAVTASEAVLRALPG